MAGKFVKNATRFDPYKNFKFRVKPRVSKPSRGKTGLPVDELARLDEVVDDVRRGRLVDRVTAGALFVGMGETGKTIAAEIIADELGVDLYRVDLSKIVSKYVGETEEHLNRIFDSAEGANALLFFDEADALFGKRSEVKDSHDRYANIEVSYLLQRIEAFNGIVILATNRKSSIDEAFLRRIRHVIDFPLPGRDR